LGKPKASGSMGLIFSRECRTEENYQEKEDFEGLKSFNLGLE
jgi:hypothetical protein